MMTALHYFSEALKLICCFCAPFYFLRYRGWKSTAMLLKSQRDEMMEITNAALTFDYPRLARLLGRAKGKPSRGDA